MKIVFIMRHSGYVRNFESTIRLLCRRGHHVHLAFQGTERRWLIDVAHIPETLAAEFSTFSYGMAPVRDDGWGLLGRELRRSLDYLRYFSPQYREAPKLRRRAAARVDDIVIRAAERGPAARWWLARALRYLDRSVPPSPDIDRFLDTHRPDLLLVTPLIWEGSSQSDFVRSAQARGIRTVFCVASWDNLTNKGLIHEQFDLITVWNEAMKREAVELHGVPPERISVTGAQPFDHWFGRQPATSREVFCERVGLRPGVPYLLYLCSSKFVAPDEAPFVRQWVTQLRTSSSDLLRQVGVLVRPHPQNARQWDGFDTAGMGTFAIFPEGGAPPVDETSRADYFDSMYHSAAVVGVNTTAEIESAIVGRPVFTYLAPEFRETQEGTLHFHHLRDENSGLVQVADTFSDHLAQLDQALRRPRDHDDRCRKFVETFVRPYGIEQEATKRLVETVEGVAAQRAPRRVNYPVRVALGRVFLRPLAERARRKATAAASDKARRSKQRRLVRRERRTRERSMRRPSAAAASASDSAGPGARRKRMKRHPVTDVIEAFQTLKRADRVRFVRENAGQMPAHLWFTLQNLTAERLDYDAAEIVLRVTSKFERRRLRSCAKEPFTVKWIETMVGAGEVFYDIGANVGAYSLIAAKKPTGAAEVYAFEPSLVNASALSVNIALNHLTDRVTPLPIALSDTNSVSKFNLRLLEPGGAKHMLHTDSPDGPTVYSQPVLTYRLDDLIKAFGLPAPNHIKLDVDGSEVAVLEGARQTLQCPALKTMLVEVSTELSDTVVRFIESCGLKISWRANVRSKSGEYRVWYGLFLRNPDGPVVLPTQPAAEVVK